MVERLQVPCCIAGGGPAGMMLGLLLARAGVRVLVLEKHRDFLRDFRGDTIHPSTLEVLRELGLLDLFLQRPHQKATHIRGHIGNRSVTVADFSHLPVPCRFVAFMPQWNFLNFLLEQASHYRHFELLMETEAIGLLRERALYGAPVRGLRARSHERTLEIGAEIVIGADGRHSVIRQAAGLPVMQIGAPMDVLWMRFSRSSSDPQDIFARIIRGRMMVMIDRGDYWQAAYVIPKGDFDALKTQGLAEFRRGLEETVPFLEDRTGELDSWDDVKLLTVRVDRLRRWYAPGVLCIGDAAHAMSPIGGVGINLAVQDAVAAGRILAGPLQRRAARTSDLRAVQRRRELPARLTQAAQVYIQNHLITHALDPGAPAAVPWPFRMLDSWPFLRRIPGYLIGLGFLREHVGSGPGT